MNGQIYQHAKCNVQKYKLRQQNKTLGETPTTKRSTKKQDSVNHCVLGMDQLVIALLKVVPVHLPLDGGPTTPHHRNDETKEDKLKRNTDTLLMATKTQQ